MLSTVELNSTISADNKTPVVYKALRASWGKYYLKLLRMDRILVFWTLLHFKFQSLSTARLSSLLFVMYTLLEKRISSPWTVDFPLVTILDINSSQNSSFCFCCRVYWLQTLTQDDKASVILYLVLETKMKATVTMQDCSWCSWTKNKKERKPAKIWKRLYQFWSHIPPHTWTSSVEDKETCFHFFTGICTFLLMQIPLRILFQGKQQ